MPLLLPPSRHWLIALVPLSVACAALVWPGKESSQDGAANKRSKMGFSVLQSSKPAAENPMLSGNLNPDQPPDGTSNDPDSSTEQPNWQTLPGKLLATIKKLDS